MTIRTALLEARLICRRRARCSTTSIAASTSEVVQGTGARIRRRQARRARRAPPRAGAVALSGRAQRQGRQGRPARPAHAVLDRQICLPRARPPTSWSSTGVFTRAEYRTVPPLRGFPLGGALPSAFPHRPRRGAALLRRAARDGRAARLHRASGPAGRRALHEALLPGRQGRRRPDRASSAPRSRSSHAKPAPGLNRMLAPLRAPRAGADRRTSTDFVVDNDRINVADAEVFERDPVNLIRLFQLAERTTSPSIPTRMRGVTPLAPADRRGAARRRGGQPAVPRDPDLAKRIPSRRCGAMNEAGVLGRFVPEFGHDRRDDAVQHVSPLHGRRAPDPLRSACWPRSSAATHRRSIRWPTRSCRGIKNRDVLYVALFLHDIAKGRPEDHSIAGARIARQLLPAPRPARRPRPRPSPGWSSIIWSCRRSRSRATSTTARPSRISPRSCRALERLKLLLILTVADIRAVGPGVWNGWKGAAPAHALLRDRAGADRRLLRGEPRPRASSARRPNCAAALAGLAERRGATRYRRAATTRPTG